MSIVGLVFRRIQKEPRICINTTHTNFAAGINEEIDRIHLNAGEKFVVESIEFRQKGGGSENTNHLINITDRGTDGSESNIIKSTYLNTESENGAYSGNGSIVTIDIVTNVNPIDASIRVIARITGA